jgi:hypothetical protein
VNNGVLSPFIMANKKRATCAIAFIQAYWKCFEKALTSLSMEG